VTGMPNPDDVTGMPTGIAAVLSLSDVMSSGFGSSTHGGATEGVRDGLSTGLDPITAEQLTKPTATQDVDPDIYHSSIGIGVVDGTRPDLAAGAGSVELPTTTGTNPYGSSDNSATTVGGFEHASLQSLDGAHVDANAMAFGALNPDDLSSEHSNLAPEQSTDEHVEHDHGATQFSADHDG
jgi:hypothetical protein